QKKVNGISKNAIKGLLEYDYPGNVRELENLIMAAMSMTEEKEVLTFADLFKEEVCVLIRR
ncbi:MAG TPA: hypothetical protein VN381_07200, partial [Anaerovoracaceae bacterium]|nr:hypothetical protein [Anaerovoracaceae bacterium]